MVNRRNHGPFTWTKRVPDDLGRSNEEVWELQHPTKMTHFVLKNYGGKPTDTNAFSGWRLVSGGPFTSAGGWDNLDDAIVDVTPWLIKYYRKQAADLIADARGILEAIHEFENTLSEGSRGD